MSSHRPEQIIRTSRLIRTHRVECTGPGEVTCAGCRDLGWMDWIDYYEHIAEALNKEGLLVHIETEAEATATDD